MKKYSKEEICKAFSSHLSSDVCRFPNIDKELSKYSSALRLEFIELFPSDGQFTIPVSRTIIIKARAVGMTTMGVPSVVHDQFIKFSSEQDFWQRWGRFKNLKAFL